MEYWENKELWYEALVFIKECRENNPFKANCTIEDFLIYHHEQVDKFNKLEIVNILHQEPSFKKAFSIVLKKHIDLDENLFKEYINNTDSTYTKCSIAETYLPSNYWRSGLIILLNHYLFTDYNAIEKASKNWQKYEQEILKNIDRLSPILENSAYFSTKPEAIKQKIKQSISSGITRAWYKPELSIDTSSHAILYGFTGLEGRKIPEQDFVKGMYYENKSFFRSPKTDAIAELMTLPCFKHSYDVRHIARICSAQKEIAELRRRKRIEREEERRKKDDILREINDQ